MNQRYFFMFPFSLKWCNKKKKRRIESSFRWLLHFHSLSDELKHAAVAVTQTIITGKREKKMKGEPFDYTDYSFVDEFLIKNISWNVCICRNWKLHPFGMRFSSARSDCVVWVWYFHLLSLIVGKWAVFCLMCNAKRNGGCFSPGCRHCFEWLIYAWRSTKKTLILFFF